MEREAIAELLMDHVRLNKISKIEEMLKNGDTASWRHIIRYEFRIEKIMDTILRYEILLPHLLSYEITSLSPFHLAALSGHNDVLINFIDHDIPVDIGLCSGTTALHMASLAGNKDTVNVLLNVYKAEVNRKDNYGWTALHYAATEGHLETLKALIEGGGDPNLRDKDGTAPAFRAQTNGHVDVVSYLMEYADPESLNVMEEDDEEDEDKRQSFHPLYASINSLTKIKRRPTKPQKPEHLRNIKLNEVVPTPQGSQAEKQSILSQPRETRNCSVRRLIRRELESVLNPTQDPDYEVPMDVKMRAKSLKQKEKDTELKLSDVGLSTLTGIMREELAKYRDEIMSPSASASIGAHGCTGTGSTVGSDVKARDRLTYFEDNDAYEDIYACIRDLGPPPETPPATPTPTTPLSSPQAEVRIAPPLPPRTDSVYEDRVLTLGRQGLPSGELVEALVNIAPKLEGNWKKLAHALPLENTPEKVEDRIKDIVQRFPNDKTKQAANALSQWKAGNDATYEHLVDALRRCNLGEIICDIEVLTQEFSA